MENTFVYFLGGPADLTKKVLDRAQRHGDLVRFAVVEPLRASPFYDTRREENISFRTALYRLREVDRNLFVAIFDQFE